MKREAVRTLPALVVDPLTRPLTVARFVAPPVAPEGARMYRDPAKPQVYAIGYFDGGQLGYHTGGDILNGSFQPPGGDPPRTDPPVPPPAIDQPLVITAATVLPNQLKTSAGAFFAAVTARLLGWL